MTALAKDAQLIVNKAVKQFHCDLPASLTRYLSEILQWNPVLGLVSRRDPLAACGRLLFESIELGRLLEIEHGRRIADVGSGAGFPGMVWALMCPHLEVVLVERREKRALFLERTCRTLGLSKVIVAARDLRDVSREITSDNTFDVVSAMAVGEPEVIAPDVSPLLAPAGRFASTVPRHITPPAQIDGRLHLLRHVPGEFGCYAIYHRGV